MEQPEPWRHLLERFLALISKSTADEPLQWHAVWQLLLQDPWFRAQLSVVVRGELRSYRQPARLQHELENEVCLLLARQLRRAPDLHIDPRRADRHFPGWLRTITSRACRDVLRRHRRNRMNELVDPELLVMRENRERRDALIDLAEAIDRCDEKTRTILHLYSKGHTFQEVARELGLPLWDTYNTYRKGITKLKRELGTPD